MRTNLADVAKAFIAKNQFGHALAVVAMIMVIAVSGVVGSAVGLPQIVSSVKAAVSASPAPPEHQRAITQPLIPVKNKFSDAAKISNDRF